jgi:GT2 family glycosyltransferase
MPDRLVSIVIPCYGERSYTELCVASIQEHSGEVPWELILVDNGSPDDTLAWANGLAGEDPRIRVVPLTRNTGFARGVNAGLAVARGTEIVVLNNDAVVTAGWLAGMLAVLAERPQVGVVGPMCNYIAGPQRVRDLPYDDDLEEMHAFAASWSKAHKGERFSIVRIVGFCMLMRRAVIERIGGFDPVFGNGNFEDDEFCVRVRIAGFELAIAGDVFLHHFGSRTFFAIGKAEENGILAAYNKQMVLGWDRFAAKWGFDPDVPFKDPDRIAAIPYDSTAHRIPLALPGLYRLSTSQRGWEAALVDYIRRHEPHTPGLMYLEAGENLAEIQVAALEAIRGADFDPERVPDIDIVPKAPEISADITNWMPQGMEV